LRLTHIGYTRTARPDEPAITRLWRAACAASIDRAEAASRCARRLQIRELRPASIGRRHRLRESWCIARLRRLGPWAPASCVRRACRTRSP